MGNSKLSRNYLQRLSLTQSLALFFFFVCVFFFVFANHTYLKILQLMMRMPIQFYTKNLGQFNSRLL